jgi:hypothetical protein
MLVDADNSLVIGVSRYAATLATQTPTIGRNLARIGEQLITAEKSINRVIPRIPNEPSTENSVLREQYKALKSEVISLRERIEVLEQEKNNEEIIDVENYQSNNFRNDKQARIQPIKYPGSVANFGAWMEGFLTRHEDYIEIEESNKIYRIVYTPIAQTRTREAWRISLEVGHGMGRDTSKEERDAMILALEELPNKTTVEFIDGAYYKPSSLGVMGSLYRSKQDSPPPYQPKPEKVFNYPTGGDLVLIAEQIKAELAVNIQDTRDIQASPLQEPTTHKLRDWFDYLHAVKHRTRIKLAYIAEKTGYKYSNVRKEHSRYMAERGISEKREVTKSNKK